MIKKGFVLFGSIALALMVAGCNDDKTADKVGANQGAVVKVVNKPAAGKKIRSLGGTETISLAKETSVTWIQDNVEEKMMPRKLFSDASDSLYESLNMPAGIPASVSAFLVKDDGEFILFDRICNTIEIIEC